MMHAGLKVQVSPDHPRYTLDAQWLLPCGVLLTLDPAFVRETNEWSDRVLGTRPNMVPDGQAYVLNGDTAIMNPRTYARFKAALR